MDANTVGFFVNDALELVVADGGRMRIATESEALSLPDLVATALRAHAKECDVRSDAVIAETKDGFITMDDLRVES